MSEKKVIRWKKIRYPVKRGDIDQKCRKNAGKQFDPEVARVFVE